MHPYVHAERSPDKPAIIMAGSGEQRTYRELDERSNRIAHLFRSLGLQDGQAIAILMENHLSFFDICWAAQRSGLYYTCISQKLSADEAAYICADSNAQILVASPATLPLAQAIVARRPDVRLFVAGGTTAELHDLQKAADRFPALPIVDESNGTEMLYSSGTTGRPKGIKPERPMGPLAQETGLTKIGRENYHMNGNCIYLSPAPLYHAAPLRWCMTVHRLGGTTIIMERFDAEETLKLIELHRVTHAQFVPTHFVRLLKLPEEIRSRYDVSSLRSIVHAAAPCPVPVKQDMIRWWGPIIHEYYAGTESNGYTAITSEEWLERPGSVGRSLWGEVKICDDDDNVLPPSSEGLIYFANGPKFFYHNDPEKTKEATNRHGWTTLGDIGWLDEGGYLYLTDRKTFMIISGGVNIYPQEIENMLITHPKITDVAVIGAPDEDLGEKVVAVIQPACWEEAGDELAEEIIAYARNHLSHVKAPRKIDFIQEMPRLPTGKLPKRLIRDPYWKQPA